MVRKMLNDALLYLNSWRNTLLSLSFSLSFTHSHTPMRARSLFLSLSLYQSFWFSSFLNFGHSSIRAFLSLRLLSLSLSSLSLLISLQAISKKTSFFFPISEKASVRKKPLVRTKARASAARLEFAAFKKVHLLLFQNWPLCSLTGDFLSSELYDKWKFCQLLLLEGTFKKVGFAWAGLSVLKTISFLPKWLATNFCPRISSFVWYVFY